jgi:hypothetical protein
MEDRRVQILDQIDQLTHDPRSDRSQDVQKLKEEYNEIVDKMYNERSSTPRDILEIFPPEVWIQIVEDALPERGYSSALLLLTMVSNKWMEALTSVPTLWAYIDVRGSQEDLLATIETFRQLSRDMFLHVSIHIPPRYDHATLCTTLTSVGPKIREVTIKLDIPPLFVNDMWILVQSLLTGSQFNSSLVYINLPSVAGLPPDGATTQLLTGNSLPPLLRSIRGWYFEWPILQRQYDYLERLEDINSTSPIESISNHRTQLPNLRSLGIFENMGPGAEPRPEGGGDLPSLGRLTSLTIFASYREIVMQLLHSVAPQLVHLHLVIPYTKIPLLCGALQATTNLRTLVIRVEETEVDGGVGQPGVCPIYKHINNRSQGLRNLTLFAIAGEQTSAAKMEHRAPFLSYLMSNLSALYTKVGILNIRFTSDLKITEDTLSYVTSLAELTELHLDWHPGYFPETKATYTLGRLERLIIRGIEILQCLCTPSILSLSFTWGRHRHLDDLRYTDLQKLVVDDFGEDPRTFELLESSFPSLQELTLNLRHFDLHGTYKRFELHSFNFLRSITISSSIFEYQPQGTMLCFALLNHPSTCPALNEIRFMQNFPDWDILFLMLEKRNFMVDSAVSLIRRITLPCIPSGLRTPLASLLRGSYTERPSNEELFMGGAQELLLDEQVSVVSIFF